MYKVQMQVRTTREQWVPLPPGQVPALRTLCWPPLQVSLSRLTSTSEASEGERGANPARGEGSSSLRYCFGQRQRCPYSSAAVLRSLQLCLNPRRTVIASVRRASQAGRLT